MDHLYDYTPHDDLRSPSYNYGCMHLLVTFAFGILILLAMALLNSCTTPKVIEREHTVVKTDTVYQQRMQRDSIFLHDSIYVSQWQRGDTVRIETERWHTRYQDRIIRDTAYISCRDTVTQTRTRTVTVERRLTQWQQAQIHLGRLTLLLLFLTVVYYLVRWYLHTRQLLP